MTIVVPPFMMLVSMSDPGLLILPTHRLVSGPGTLERPGGDQRPDAG